ncbi:MAG: type II toxin-antitoxin system VapC family toxin [Armatimonadota bacterium]|nr:type II toxin-antitoxin system VapC family toxin [Armatimonadota bacterium]
MYVLDTDTTSNFFRGGNTALIARVLSESRENIWLPVIVAEEQLKGRLAVIAKLNSASPQDGAKSPRTYDFLIRTMSDLAEFGILPYTDEAEQLFRRWSPAEKRAGTRDCKIAAIAITYGFTVVTSNTNHYRSIPNVRLVDWNTPR